MDISLTRTAARMRRAHQTRGEVRSIVRRARQSQHCRKEPHRHHSDRRLSRPQTRLRPHRCSRPDRSRRWAHCLQQLPPPSGHKSTCRRCMAPGPSRRMMHLQSLLVQIGLEVVALGAWCGRLAAATTRCISIAPSKQEAGLSHHRRSDLGHCLWCRFPSLRLQRQCWGCPCLAIRPQALAWLLQVRL